MDVPEDIREKAKAVWADAVEQSRREATVIDVSVLIAQALLSERLAQKERDAKIAEEAFQRGMPIAAAIREQP